MVARASGEPDYYAILQVAPDATAAAIERAYRARAGRQLRRWWRRKQADRELASINAAYAVLGYTERRVEYDTRRASAHEIQMDVLDLESAESGGYPSYRKNSRRVLPRVQVGRVRRGNAIEGLMILLVVVLALFVGSVLISQSLVSLAPLQSLGETLGLSGNRRRAAPSPTVQAGAEARPSPLPTAAPALQTREPVPATSADAVRQRFAGSEATVSDPNPAQNANLTVTLRLLRDGLPAARANVYLVAYYRTVEERQPPGMSTVTTGEDGIATIEFNIGEATPRFEVRVDVTALLDGQQVVLQTAFSPR